MIRRPGIRLSRPTTKIRSAPKPKPSGSKGRVSNSNAQGLRQEQMLKGLGNREHNSGRNGNQSLPDTATEQQRSSQLPSRDRTQSSIDATLRQHTDSTQPRTPQGVRARDARRAQILRSQEQETPSAQALNRFYRQYWQSKPRLVRRYMSQILILRSFYARYLSSAGSHDRLMRSGFVMPLDADGHPISDAQSYFSGDVIGASLRMRWQVSESIAQLQRIAQHLHHSHQRKKLARQRSDAPAGQTASLYASIGEVQRELRLQTHYKEALDLELEKVLAIFNPDPKGEEWQLSLLDSHQVLNFEQDAKTSEAANAWKNRFVTQAQRDMLAQLAEDEPALPSASAR